VVLDLESTGQRHAACRTADRGGRATVWSAIQTDLHVEDLPDPWPTDGAPFGAAAQQGTGAGDCIRRAAKDPFDIVPASLDWRRPTQTCYRPLTASGACPAWWSRCGALTATC